MKKLASLSLRPGPNAVPQALAWMESLGEQQQWDARTLFTLNLCMDEALTNIVMYAFSGDTAAPAIELSVSGDDRHIVLGLVDNGVAYDPTQSSPGDLATSLDDAVAGGHGLRILKHYLENMTYQRIDGRNHLHLTMAPGSRGTDT